MLHLTNNRAFVTSIFLIVVLLVVSTTPASAVEGPVVILMGSNVEPYKAAAEGATQALGEERTVVLPVNADIDQMKHTMEKVSLLSAKAIIAVGSEAALAVRSVSITVPVVFCLVVDHNEWLKQPRSWAVSFHLSPEDSFKRIRQAFPNKRIAIPYNPERTAPLVKELTGYFGSRNIDLLPIVVRKPAELGPSLAAARSKYDVLWIIPDPSFIDPLSVNYFMDFAMTERIPIIGYSEALAKNGAVLSVVGAYDEMGKQAAELALRVLAGNLPPRVEFPKKVRTYLNVRVARILDLKISDTLLAQADRLYPLDPGLRIK